MFYNFVVVTSQVYSNSCFFLQDCPSPIALEPCSGNRAAVLSLLVRLPTGMINISMLIDIFSKRNHLLYKNNVGGLQHAPCGQSAGLAVASALVTLGNPRRPSIEHSSKEPKSKRKQLQSQHPDSCT